MLTGKQVSTTMGGFTPSFDCIVQDIGIVGAAVFGRVWRYCQGPQGVCRAAIATIADGLNLSTRTVLRWVKELCDLGYLEDMTPELRNKPHTYRDTGKVSLQVQVVAVTESPATVTESHSAVTESHSHYDRKSLEETSKRQSKRPKEREGASAPPPPAQEEKEPEPEPEQATAKHPAIQAYREVARLYPSRAWYQAIADTIGEAKEDIARWRRIVMAWVGVGWNPRNVSGMLDYWGKAALPGEDNGHGSSTPRRQGQGDRGYYQIEKEPICGPLPSI